jgi:charged multivesicular body protein 6
MGGAFSHASSSSSKKKAPGGSISSVDRAVLDLKNARDRLSRYKQKLEKDEGKLVTRAKEAKLEGQTKTALNLLRLRKIKLREVETAEGQLLTVMQMVQTIDSKLNEAQVLAAMAKGKDTLQKMHEETTVDHVLELMDQIQEQNEVEREISDVLEGAPSLSTEDEAAVEAELEALMQESQPATTTELPVAPAHKPLPVAPTGELPATATAEPEKRVAVSS